MLNRLKSVKTDCEWQQLQTHNPEVFLSKEQWECSQTKLMQQDDICDRAHKTEQGTCSDTHCPRSSVCVCVCVGDRGNRKMKGTKEIPFLFSISK